MSFIDIGAITKKLKLEVEQERGHLDEDDDIKSKSKTTQAIKLFCEGKNTVDVVIALDLPADDRHATRTTLVVELLRKFKTSPYNLLEHTRYNVPLNIYVNCQH